MGDERDLFISEAYPPSHSTESLLPWPHVQKLEQRHHANACAPATAQESPNCVWADGTGKDCAS